MLQVKAAPLKSDHMVVQHIPVGEIYADEELNCRGKIIPRYVTELANSIEKNGLLEPIQIEPYDKVEGYKYRVILGHRRLKAFEIKGWDTIPSIIRTGLTEIQVRVLNLQENLAREDLNIMQEALAMKKFKDIGYTLNEVANLVGMSTTWVQVRFHLLDLEPEIQEAAAAKFLTQEQIKDIHALPTREQRYAAAKQIKESKERGEKKPIKIKKAKRRLSTKKLRGKEEIFELVDAILDSLGQCLATRCLAWAAGEISDLDVYEDIKKECEEQGVYFTIPTSQALI
jgi:ParB/RepB/Spo0J family partition protein